MVIKASSSEPLGADQRVDEIDEQTDGDERTQAVIDDHGFSSEPIAGDGVEHSSGQKYQADRYEENVEHREAPYWRTNIMRNAYKNEASRCGASI
jgi:hypothetical protein